MVADTADAFAPYVGQSFTAADSLHTLELVSVDRHASPGLAVRAPFTLIFRGPPSAVLPEGHHSFALADGRTVAFYIMPIHTPSRDRQDYQAIFN